MQIFLKNNWLKIVVIIALIASAFATYSQITAQNTKTATEKYDAKKDKLVSPSRQTIKDEITLAGSIAAEKVATVRFQNSGKLVWVGVKVGDRVKKYQALASLDKNELKKSLQTQFNDYRTNLSTFWDTQDKYKDTDITTTVRRILERTQYSLDNTVIDYEIADMAIAEATIYSPIAGVVTGVEQPLPGVNITPATATFTIVDPDSLYLKSEVDQEQVIRVKNGQKAILKLDSFPEKEIDSQVSYISFSPIAGQTSTVYEIRFPLFLKNSDLSYRLGMDGDVTIFIGQSENALTVPLDAIYDDEGKSYVLVKNENQLERRYIETGIENDTDLEILNGLNGNETLVIKKS